MTKRPSKLELYTCHTLLWTSIIGATIAMILALTVIALGGETSQRLGSIALLPVIFALWATGIQVRQLRWTLQNAADRANRILDEHQHWNDDCGWDVPAIEVAQLRDELREGQS